MAMQVGSVLTFSIKLIAGCHWLRQCFFNPPTTAPIVWAHKLAWRWPYEASASVITVTRKHSAKGALAPSKMLKPIHENSGWPRIGTGQMYINMLTYSHALQHCSLTT